MKEYHFITHIKLEHVTKTLNTYAEQGWKVVSHSMVGFVADQTEYSFVLERDKK